MEFWGRYVPVAERRANAQRQMNRLRKQGKAIQPVAIEGRAIARSFWGKGWCDHLESFSDYANRLPRGRTYVRNGSVCHLEIRPGRIEAMVSGSDLYKVSIDIASLAPKAWASIRKTCAGEIGSLLELLQGKLSDRVMAVVSDRRKGLFPQPGEISLNCSCPDWATMCKHVAATLYGVGNRLDTQPELLFLLRGVDAEDLIATEISLPAADPAPLGATLADGDLADIFGIEIDLGGPPTGAAPPSPSRGKRTRRAPVTRKKKQAAPKPPARLNPKGKAEAIRRRHRKAATTPPASEAPVPDAPLPKLRPTAASVARLRRQLRLSVAEFADALGVSAASIYRWEAASGRLSLHARPLKALAMLQQQASKKKQRRG